MYKHTLILCLLCSSPTLFAADINKCVVGGKTIYSDQSCPKTGVSRPLELNHAAGIVSPDRATVTDTINRMYDERWANAVPGRTITRTTTRNGNSVTNTIDNPLPAQRARAQPNKATLCADNASYIKHLDGMARQPQSGATQDWIKAEKTRTQANMFAAGC